jgi:hypothetical protein
MKEWSKEYYENNIEHIKEYLKEYKKEYYENNKKKLNEKINCECGGLYTYNNKARHFKSNKHLKYIESLEK